MRVLLVGTYELGHQPLQVASAAAELSAAGHEVVTLDLAVEKWDPARLVGVGAVAVSVPMHTGLRLAIEVGKRIRTVDPDLPVAFFGLYASVGSEATHPEVADRLITGEHEDALVEWVQTVNGGRREPGVTVHIGRRPFRTPSRGGLPELGAYAHLATPEGHRMVGYVEASHGCRHRCTHCPIPAVYDGRYRVTGAETVMADIAQLVDAGAGHITFGDPDFLNAPAYSLKVLEAAHDRFPELGFDVTVKVEHLLGHRHLLDRMSDAGVIFITTAVETLDDRILELLDKGHTGADAAVAVDLVRRAGMEVHPTWLPFTPWTTAGTVAEIARFVWGEGLAAVTDPVQLSIRLLIPDGSLMLGLDELTPHLTGYDPAALGYSWRSADPAMDELQRRLAATAESGSAPGVDQLETLARMTEMIGEEAGVVIPAGAPAGAADPPRLTEPWFC